MHVRRTMEPAPWRWCVELDLVKAGPRGCRRFAGVIQFDPRFVDLDRGVTSTRAPVAAINKATGAVRFVSPPWYSRRRRGQRKGQVHKTTVCGRYKRGVDGKAVTKGRLNKAVRLARASCTLC